MQGAIALLQRFDPADLKFFAKRISGSIDLSLNALFSPEKLAFYEETLGLTVHDLKVLEEFTKYIYTVAAGQKNFAPAREIMEKIGMDEERCKVLEKVFQDNAQGIVDAVRRRVTATDHLVDNFSMRVFLPLIDGQKPQKQDCTTDGKIKLSYAPDIRQPTTKITFSMKEASSDPSAAINKIQTIDLTKNQLIELFAETEKIKENLDRMYGN